MLNVGQTLLSVRCTSNRNFHQDPHPFPRSNTSSKNDLYTPLAHGHGQTPLRELLVAADHNAYHLGQLVTVRRILGA
ncbi:MAG TPA: hypothetical protein VGF69_21045 [Thermoanaerobaculia bacterium]|jgi:hypothetical protein